jgi:ABC-type bacteriocin/lantibiotic exporter with double-glycine peptidase domain
MTLRFVILLSLFLCYGCSPFQRHEWSPGKAGLRAVPGVPFLAQQGRDDCGPAALASLLAHGGKEMPLETVTRAVYTPALGGSMLPDMENFARLQGFTTHSGRGDLEFLRHQIDAGRPVIIPVETGFWWVSRPHYLVVFGYDETHFLIHEGVQGGLFIDNGELQTRWEKMNGLYLYLE